MLRSRGFAAVFVLLGLGVLLGACGGGASDEELEKARQEGAQQAREQAQIEALEDKVKELEQEGGGPDSKGGGTDDSGSGGSDSGSGSGSGTDSGSGPVTTCADDVQAGANTSCAFAINVAGEYGSNPGATTINAYSPTTGEYYTMTCSTWTDGRTVCRGGNNAAVFIGG
jgi:hypothetical protein